MQKRVECTIFGRVQMVMYRDFVLRNARRLGLVGEVWNRKDGTVFVVSEGEEEQLRILVHALHEGSLLSHVECVQASWSDAVGAFTQFTIRYGEETK